ncbi:MAG: glycosyltransferase family 4 protein, partial [Actinobacteria bacterium]|nr:glycosyltransferase family 4 protein [Actinomycetota bacterium]
MKIGIVCPYDWAIPGGVSIHIRDLALELMERGHEVNVLAPTSDESVLPSWVTSGGTPVSISYNGSVARITFGYKATKRVQKWIDNGQFDVLHIHEPLTPSLSALACWAASGPVVGTFHSAMDKSRILSAGYNLAQTVLEKLSARVAVSELARNTVVEHVGGDAVLIPNGVHIDSFISAKPFDANPFNGKRDQHAIAFLGRFEENRKGFKVLLEAFEQVANEFPNHYLLVAGPGEQKDSLKDFPEELHSRIKFLGRVSDEDKARMLQSSAMYVAPNTGGESFGIVLLEAMACHTPVIASDLPAFNRVLDFGTCGLLFENENPQSLANAIRETIAGKTEVAKRVETAY